MLNHPTIEIIEKTRKYLYKLLYYEKITPVRIASTIEEGMFLAFRNRRNGIMYMELYNDGDIGYIVINLDTKKIIENKEIQEREVVDSVVRFMR